MEIIFILSLKIIKLILKVTKGSIVPQTNSKTGQNSMKSPFLAQSPPQKLNTGPRNRPNLLVYDLKGKVYRRYCGKIQMLFEN